MVSSVGIGWVQRFYAAMREMSEFQREFLQRRAHRSRTGLPARGFARYRDAAGRFTLLYPSEWTLEAGDGVFAMSRLELAFAGVHVYPAASFHWSDLELSLEGSGGVLEVTRRWSGPPERVRGRIAFAGRSFLVDITAHRRGETVILLTLGRQAGEERIRRWEDGVLDLIRRRFEILPPLPVSPVVETC